jgi:uncharacterized membrane protein
MSYPNPNPNWTSEQPADAGQLSGAQQYGNFQPQPPDYRGWVTGAIIGGVLFSLIIGLPLAIVARRKSRRVSEMWQAGDARGAEQASKSARGWLIAASVIEVIGFIYVITIFTHS